MSQKLARRKNPKSVCAGPETGLNDPCGLLPTQDILCFCELSFTLWRKGKITRSKQLIRDKLQLYLILCETIHLGFFSSARICCSKIHYIVSLYSFTLFACIISFSAETRWVELSGQYQSAEELLAREGFY